MEHIPADSSSHSPMKEKKPGLLTPPPHPGMKALDKRAFSKEIQIPVLVTSSGSVPVIRKALKPFLLKMSKFKQIQDDPSDATKKKFYMNPEVVTTQELNQFLTKELGIDASLILSTETELVTFGYENWRSDDIIRAILPDDVEGVSSFTMVGHILHLNLRDSLLPYKKILGQVFLDNVPQAKTVVNKIQTIENTYRNFEMEVLAGDPNTVVKLKENGGTYEFDFAKVYWNSRLSAEHERILHYMRPGHILFDVFGGVGPFAIPAAKKKCIVYVNDLNPDSYKWLLHNVQLNKVTSCVSTFNLDGKDFIQYEFPKIVSKSEPFQSASKIIHVVMNLPATGVDFLDAFYGVAREIELDCIEVTIHVYCFIKAAESEDLKGIAMELVRRKLRHDMPDLNADQVFFVRNVAPNKNMIRISFQLPLEILSSEAPEESNKHDGSDSIPPFKKLKNAE